MNIVASEISLTMLLIVLTLFGSLFHPILVQAETSGKAWFVLNECHNFNKEKELSTYQHKGLVFNSSSGELFLLRVDMTFDKGYELLTVRQFITNDHDWRITPKARGAYLIGPSANQDLLYAPIKSYLENCMIDIKDEFVRMYSSIWPKHVSIIFKSKDQTKADNPYYTFNCATAKQNENYHKNPPVPIYETFKEERIRTDNPGDNTYDLIVSAENDTLKYMFFDNGTYIWNYDGTVSQPYNFTMNEKCISVKTEGPGWPNMPITDTTIMDIISTASDMNDETTAKTTKAKTKTTIKIGVTANKTMDKVVSTDSNGLPDVVEVKGTTALGHSIHPGYLNVIFSLIISYKYLNQ